MAENISDDRRFPFVNLMTEQAVHMSTMDIQAMQSMDWLFKKERIYLLAQFWQQVSSVIG